MERYDHIQMVKVCQSVFELKLLGLLLVFVGVAVLVFGTCKTYLG